MYMQLKETEDALQTCKTEMESFKAAYEKSTEISKAYCSGYKWIVKHVRKDESSDEMPDLDALENVTLIQKLERAQAENNTCRCLLSLSYRLYVKRAQNACVKRVRERTKTLMKT